MNKTTLGMSLLTVALASSFVQNTAFASETVTRSQSLSLSVSEKGYQIEHHTKTKTQGDFNQGKRFSLEIEGVQVGGVHKIEGLESEHEIVEFKDGEDGVIRTRPGKNKPAKVVIEREWSSTNELAAWRQSVLDGKVERKSISVIFNDDAGQEAKRVIFHKCYPTKWVAPALIARSSSHATEHIELSCQNTELK